MSNVLDDLRPRRKGDRDKPREERSPLSKARSLADEALLNEFERTQLDTILMEQHVKKAKAEKELVEIKETPQPGQQTSLQQQAQPVTKEDVSMGRLLIEMVGSEREARQAAERSRTEAEKNRWEAEANRIQQMITQAQQLQAKPVGQSEDSWDGFKRMKGMFDEVKNEFAKNLPQNIAPGLDGPAQIQLTQIQHHHDERMAELKHQQSVLLQQMKQTHDISMEEAKDRRLEIQLRISQIEREGQSRQQSWVDLVGLVAQGAQSAIKGDNGPMGAIVEQRTAGSPRGRTAQNLAVYKCDGCGFDIPVSPEVEQSHGVVGCPKCGVRYQVGVDSEVGPGSGELSDGGQ